MDNSIYKCCKPERRQKAFSSLSVIFAASFSVPPCTLVVASLATSGDLATPVRGKGKCSNHQEVILTLDSLWTFVGRGWTVQVWLCRGWGRLPPAKNHPDDEVPPCTGCTASPRKSRCTFPPRLPPQGSRQQGTLLELEEGWLVLAMGCLAGCPGSPNPGCQISPIFRWSAGLQDPTLQSVRMSELMLESYKSRSHHWSARTTVTILNPTRFSIALKINLFDF